MTSISQTAGAVALILLFTAGIAHTDGAGDPKAVSSREGNISTRTAIRPSRSPMMAPSTGTPMSDI